MTEEYDIEQDINNQIFEINKSLEDVNNELIRLRQRQKDLNFQKETLQKRLSLCLKSSNENIDWKAKTFLWSEDILKCLKETFKISSFRTLQLETINATMSKIDCILVMPTGAGKSLCFQLPAVISNGFTLVISPLISLMEDQLIGLKELNIEATMLNSSSSREHVTQTQNEMISSSSKLKLLYVTPEKLAKSKRFMAKLEKAYKMNTIDRIVIDEVHCTSHWGHDFRPDYKYLNILKRQFPKLPILGLTATASQKVLHDVQDILNITDCVKFRASFNRPNLFYEVKHTLLNQPDLVEEFASRIETQFPNESGIVYCFSRKDCEEVANLLLSHNITAHCYHGDMSANVKTQVHQAWAAGDLQVVVATIAFGMGIDKSNVRFVIHYSMSKSVENYYQESGRAGRDGKPAYCILYFRFHDVFRQTSMVYAEKTGLNKLHHMLRYCIENRECRRTLIGKDFGETWDNKMCHRMCDNCSDDKSGSIDHDLNEEATILVSILNRAISLDERITPLKLIDIWLGKGKLTLRPPETCVYTRQQCEMIVSKLLVEVVLKEDFHFTPYATITYLLPGPVWDHLKNDRISVSLNMSNIEFTSEHSTSKKRKSSPMKKRPKKTKQIYEILISDDGEDV